MRTDANDGVPIFESDVEAAEVQDEHADDPMGTAYVAATAVLAKYQEGWDAETLAGEPVLASGQADDLHYEEDGERLWLSRTGVADGEPFENTITIERNASGSWKTIAKYDGGELPDEDDGTLSGTFSLSIDLGNAAMCKAEHIAGAVRTLAERLEAGDEAGNVYDENGNTVGTFKFS